MSEIRDKQDRQWMIWMIDNEWDEGKQDRQWMIDNGWD